MSKKTNKTIEKELKYRLYEASVQNFEVDVDFINQEYKKHFSRAPMSIREDFGGTGALACHWVTQSNQHEAWAIDLDPEPMSYGVEKHRGVLAPAEQERVRYVEGNVLADHGFKTDVIVAFN